MAGHNIIDTMAEMPWLERVDSPEGVSALWICTTPTWEVIVALLHDSSIHVSRSVGWDSQLATIVQFNRFDDSIGSILRQWTAKVRV